MEKLIKKLIEKVKQQYKDWESFRTTRCSAKENFDNAEKIDQMQKYYYWFTEDSYDRLSDAFKRINNPFNFYVFHNISSFLNSFIDKPHWSTTYFPST